MASRRRGRWWVEAMTSNDTSSVLFSPPHHIKPCIQLEKRRTDEKAERDRLNDIYLELIEKQRAYYKTVRDFQEVGYSTNTHNTAFIFHVSLIHVLNHFLSMGSCLSRSCSLNGSVCNYTIYILPPIYMGGI